ncbi:hypothetical protein LXA43DRAFT_879351 [Ganoderma leucocontextum]|nr:hypothetical protein LXA43DRAFT_879351 [Ganoderma leucocontextum]
MLCFVLNLLGAYAVGARRTNDTEANASSSSNSRVATSSTSSRSRAAPSSPATARRTRATTQATPTLASTRSRRGTNIAAPAEPQASRNVPSIISAPPSLVQPARKRKVDVVEVVVPRPKRQRTTNSNEVQKAEAPSLPEGLKVDEEALYKRELNLKKREAALEKKEKSLTKREAKNTEKLRRLQTDKAAAATKLKELEGEVKALTATNATLEKKSHEENAEVSASPTSPGNGVGTQWILAQLEDQFQCSLCFEVMACPYQLNHGLCGHTFCALCLLQWCFAAVHRGCGYWHESLECPLCRAELPCTPDTTPRQMCTFPFVPCRIADATIKMLLGVLKDAADTDAGGRDACIGSSSKLDERVAAWGQNGNAKVEWEARDARGRAEMAMLANNWANLQGEDFVAFKDRLDSQ